MAQLLFAILGYCPGTIAGAIGNGFLDALVGGLAGILLGSGLFATAYPQLRSVILRRGDFGDLTLPCFFNVGDWAVVVALSILIVLTLYLIERAGLQRSGPQNGQTTGMTSNAVARTTTVSGSPTRI
jgi:hypothetical protein